MSITLDGQFWSEPTNVTEIEFFGVRNALTFGENEYGQLGFNKVGNRIATGYNCYGGTYHGFDCAVAEDCPAGQCLLKTRNLNHWPIFLKELFARNVSAVCLPPPPHSFMSLAQDRLSGRASPLPVTDGFMRLPLCRSRWGRRMPC